jgi:type I restriction enzyme R subunit
VVVPSDEAHRSQDRLRAQTNKAGETIYGHAKYLWDALPNATFVALIG